MNDLNAIIQRASYQSRDGVEADHDDRGAVALFTR
jgi:hypothetical protein